MSTILEAPEAQELLALTEVATNALQDCVPHLTEFVQRYLPFFYRTEHRQHAEVILNSTVRDYSRRGRGRGPGCGRLGGNQPFAWYQL